jgi:hypothetical protein
VPLAWRCPEVEAEVARDRREEEAVVATEPRGLALRLAQPLPRPGERGEERREENELR